MPNQKISELTAIVTVDNSVDVLPIVDISANTTKKVTPNALKTALALDNVNNTSDANKPVSIAQQDALNAKVTANAAITAGTAPKVTFDAKGLVTSGDSLDETDLPTGINANKIGTGVVSTTEFEYLNGVTSAIQTQIDSKQATLVSGTNIKTINSTSLVGSGDVAVQPTLVSGTNIKTINSSSLLGSGDITISANPSGVSGAIQFSNGSAFASDAANLFWDDTNNRLGIGTNTPGYSIEAVGEIRGITQVSGQILALRRTSDSAIQSTIGFSAGLEINDASGQGGRLSSVGSTALKWLTSSSQPRIGVGFNGSILATAHIQGSGSTSATTSLLVQNSAGNEALRINDDRSFAIGNVSYASISTSISAGGINTYSAADSHLFNTFTSGYVTQLQVKGVQVSVGTTSPNASAKFQVDSTTSGFLPPRMTTTQKNAISSPAAGLVVYDSTTNKLCCYNGSTWNDLF